MDRSTIIRRLENVGLRTPADALKEAVRVRIKATQDSPHRKRANDAAWEEMWQVFEPVVEKREQEATMQVQGLPDRCTKDILDPDYKEKDRGKQLRDGLLWVALEFDTVIEDTMNGPVAHLEDASVPPPNAFAIGILRTYALSQLDKRRELFSKVLPFANKTHDDAPDGGDEEGGFLHELE